jgi:hypothetical protein
MIPLIFKIFLYYLMVCYRIPKSNACILLNSYGLNFGNDGNRQ